MAAWGRAGPPPDQYLPGRGRCTANASFVNGFKPCGCTKHLPHNPRRDPPSIPRDIVARWVAEGCCGNEGDEIYMGSCNHPETDHELVPNPAYKEWEERRLRFMQEDAERRRAEEQRRAREEEERLQQEKLRQVEAAEAQRARDDAAAKKRQDKQRRAGKNETRRNGGKARPCKFHGTPGGCRNGVECSFSHGDTHASEDVTSRQKKKKSSSDLLCRFFAGGSCKFGDKCRYRHPAEDAAEGGRGAGAGECVVCCDAQVSVMLAPCRHTMLCTACAAAVETCPVCNGRIDDRVELIFS